ncbi:MAG: SGNH/GDSL hydrolase family protein [Alphaproteobacteria bacterium]|nr:SGNH/GDSL hydrolase family protein [Alphaproteobacteria bacterium]
MKRLLILACAACLGACSTMAGPAGRSAWVGAWGGSPAPSSSASPSVDDQTIRQVVRLTATGDRVRVRLTNEYNDTPLEVGAASITLAGPDGKPTGAIVPITFGGKPSVVIPRNAPMLSDPVAFPVKALDSVSISLFFPHATGPCTCHPLGTATTWISAVGDYTMSGFEPTSTVTQRPFLSAVEVERSASTRAIIAFGDSITDGYKSTPDANKRWPDVLAERLQASRPGAASVVNEAISGNQVLGFRTVVFGDPALARFDRDVLTVPNAEWMIVLEGVNDLGMGGDKRPSAETLIAGYRQIIERAHAHGLKVFGGTVLPYQGAAYYTDAGDAIRQEVNAWIRTGGGFDGVIDFDAAIRDPANPKRMRADLQSGDWLHPNDAGYKLMGDTVDMKLFR